MIRFGIYEYIRNFWFNLCVVIIMLVMMIITTVMVSNIDEQTRVYRIAEKYLDDDSMFVTNTFGDFIEELDVDGKVLVAQGFLGIVGPEEDISANVYTEEVIKYLSPRLDSGVYPNSSQTDENTISVLMSHNPYGIEVGDTFTYNIFGDDEYISVKVYVAGIISDGQNLYTEIRHIFSSMTYEDFFPVYSYEQTGDVRIIVPESEMKKIPEVKKILLDHNIIINPDDDLSDVEKNAIWNEIKKYEKEIELDITGTYPDAADLTDRNETIYISIVLKYIPLSVVIILLFSICIIGFVTIKTIKSTRYYGIMYSYGMQYNTAQLMTGLEMGFNCIVAFLATISLITLQNTFDIVGKINCKLDITELMLMLCICTVIVISSVLTARSVLKEHTPVEILKDTV